MLVQLLLNLNCCSSVAQSAKPRALSSDTGTISLLYSVCRVIPGYTNEPLVVIHDDIPIAVDQCHFHGSDELATPRTDPLSSIQSDVLSSASLNEDDINSNNSNAVIRPAGSVPIQINGVCVNVIIDTATQVFVLSTRFVDDNWSSIPYSGYVFI